MIILCFSFKLSIHIRMRILLSAYACAPDKGSEPGIGWNWANSLAQQGHTIYCLTRSVQGSATDQQTVSDMKIVYIGVWKWLEMMRKTFPYPFVYLHYLVWQYQAYLHARSMQGQLAFDVIHHVSYVSVQLGSHLWKLNVPFVFGPVGGAQKVPRTLKKYLGFGYFKEILRDLTEFVLLRVLGNTRKCLEKAVLVLVTNQETYTFAEKCGAKNIRYFLDMGISQCEAIKRTPTTEEVRILWVGKLVAIKGLDMVLEGLKAARNPRLQLTVVGDGPLYYYYRMKTLRLGISKQVHFKGMMSYHDLQQAYRDHHALVYCPLRSAFGAQLLEAMSYGLPVITLDIHGAGFFIPEGTGMKVKLPKSDSLSLQLGKAFNAIYTDQQQYEKQVRKALKFAQKHQWHKKATSILHLYDVAISGHTYAVAV